MLRCTILWVADVTWIDYQITSGHSRCWLRPTATGLLSRPGFCFCFQDGFHTRLVPTSSCVTINWECLSMPQQAGVGARQGWNFRTRMHSLHWNYQVFPCNICQMFDWSLFCFRSGFRIHFDTEYLLHKATVPHKVESIKPPISYPSRYAHNVPWHLNLRNNAAWLLDTTTMTWSWRWRRRR